MRKSDCMPSYWVKCFILFLLLSFSVAKTYAQVEFKLGLKVGIHLPTSLISNGFLTKEEFTNMFTFYNGYQFSPELGLGLEALIAQRHSIELAPSIIYYGKPTRPAFPIFLGYSFNLFKKDRTPYIKLDCGYSFFITQGFTYGLGLGYKFKSLSATVMYHSQEVAYAVLENKEFVSAKVASFSLGIKYNFWTINKKRKQTQVTTQK